MNKTLLCLAAAGILASATAAANDFSYNYVDGKLAFYPSATAGQDWFGPDVNAKFEITPEIFALGGIKYLSDDIDVTQIYAGAAYRFDVADGTDVWGGLTLEYQDFDLPVFGSNDDISLGIRGGVRHQLNPDFELGGQIRIVTGDFDYVGFSGTAQYFLNPNLGLVGSLDLFDGDFGILGGVRFNFGAM